MVHTCTHTHTHTYTDTHTQTHTHTHTSNSGSSECDYSGHGIYSATVYGILYMKYSGNVSWVMI